MEEQNDEQATVCLQAPWRPCCGHSGCRQTLAPTEQGRTSRQEEPHPLWLSASGLPFSLCKAECEIFCGQKSPRNGPIRHLEERKVKPRVAVAVLTP